MNGLTEWVTNEYGTMTAAKAGEENWWIVSEKDVKDTCLRTPLKSNGSLSRLKTTLLLEQSFACWKLPTKQPPEMKPLICYVWRYNWVTDQPENIGHYQYTNPSGRASIGVRYKSHLSLKALSWTIARPTTTRATTCCPTSGRARASILEFFIYRAYTVKAWSFYVSEWLQMFQAWSLRRRSSIKFMQIAITTQPDPRSENQTLQWLDETGPRTRYLWTNV